MRKRKSILKPLAVIFMLVFLGNTAVMRLFFGIDVLGGMPPFSVDPAEREGTLKRGEQKAEMIQEESAPAPSGAESTNSYYTLSFDPIAALQHLSLTDKLFVLSIFSKISKGGMDRIIELSDDGLAPDEYDEIKKLAENSLEPSDMERLKEIFAENQELFAQNPGE